MTKTYSLYLSTLSGRTVGCYALCTITGANEITVTTVLSGSLAIGQAFFINGAGNNITALGTGTGGLGTYTTGVSMSLNTLATLVIFYTTNNSILPAYTPVFKNNLNNMKWNVNWKEIFGNRLTGKCKVRCKLVSVGSSNIYTGENTGSIRCSLGSSYTNLTNGFNLGSINPVVDNTLPYHQYLICDTTGGEGASIIIPNENINNIFSIFLLDISESYMQNVPEYHIWLYFDVDE